MKKITQSMVDAIRAWRNWQQANTAVKLWPDVRTLKPFITVELHNNEIATIIMDVTLEPESVRLSPCGYHTPTTKERLNGVCAALNIPYFFVIRQRALTCINTQTGAVVPADEDTGDYFFTI